MTKMEKRNDLEGCIVRYESKWEAIRLIKKIKRSYVNTGKDSYKNWCEWQEIETKLNNL